MKDFRLRTIAAPCLFIATVAHAQSVPNSAVPKVVRFNSSFHPLNGAPAQTMESVTLSVYRDQTGGNALWHEIQNVVVDPDGHYSVLLGATQNDGMPLDLFAPGEPRWLGAQFNRPGESEQPRVLLVSVPYALKAADAETLGGKPASAYLLAAPAPAVGTDATEPRARNSPGLAPASGPVKPKATPSNSGLPNYIGKFANTTDLVDSAMYELNGNIGISTTNPLISLDARTGPFPQMGMAQTVDYLTFFASDKYGPAIYWDPGKDMRFGKGGTGLYNPFGFVEYMRIQSSTGNVGIGTQTPGSTLDVAGDVNFTGNVLYRGVPLVQVPGAFLNDNIALGIGPLQKNTSGNSNTVEGFYAMAQNTTGDENTAIGHEALNANTTGFQNTAVGSQALIENTEGIQNTAVGQNALQINTTGMHNIGVGVGALSHNSAGIDNIAMGYLAAFGVSGNNSNNIHIGSVGASGDNRTIRIGGSPLAQTSFFVSGVRGVTTANNDAVSVVIDSAGQLGTVSSSRRFKEDIADMGAASRDLMRLRPVSFRYQKPFADGSKPIQYGLIAEEVAEVYPDLVAHSADGQIETVKYQVLDSMLLNELQRQQAQIRKLEERLAKLEAALASANVP